MVPIIEAGLKLYQTECHTYELDLSLLILLVGREGVKAEGVLKKKVLLVS